MMASFLQQPVLCLNSLLPTCSCSTCQGQGGKKSEDFFFRGWDTHFYFFAPSRVCLYRLCQKQAKALLSTTAWSRKGMAPVPCDTGTARAGDSKVGLWQRQASPGQSMLCTQRIYFHFRERWMAWEIISLSTLCLFSERIHCFSVDAH